MQERQTTNKTTKGNIIYILFVVMAKANARAKAKAKANTRIIIIIINNVFGIRNRNS